MYVSRNKSNANASSASPHLGTNTAYQHIDNTCAVCKKTATNVCNACKTVYYCSREHQVAHWKAGHKKACKELKEKNTQNMNDEMSPRYQPIGKTCVICQKTAKKSCSACRSVYYCSKEHQKTDWRANHKQKCELLKKQAEESFAHALQRQPAVENNWQSLQKRIEAVDAKLKLASTAEEKKAAKLEQMELLGQARQSISMLTDFTSNLKQQKHPSDPGLNRDVKALNKLLQPLQDVLNEGENELRNL